MTVEVIIANAEVVTMDVAHPRAEAVAIANGRVTAVGSLREIQPLGGPDTRWIDADGGTVLPGFVDPHLHLIGYASHLTSIDLSSARSIAEMAAVLRHHSPDRRASGASQPWIAGVGYDEWRFRERRHPNRHDLDAAIEDAPVRVRHRSGHASVLNTRALSEVGIAMDTEEPRGGTIDRDVATGQPSGLLIDMESFLAERIPQVPPSELDKGIREASALLLRWGVTAIEDASPNDGNALQQLERLVSRNEFKPGIAAMADGNRTNDLLGEGLRFGQAVGPLPIRELKIVLTASSGRLVPSEDELADTLARAEGAGWPVAVHATEVAALDAILRVWHRVSGARTATPSRIEHASVCPPDLLTRLARQGWRVVTQPAFLYWSGDRYQEDVDAAEQPWLYQVRAFIESGLLVAGSSDAPVVLPDPRAGLYGAMTRRSRSGGQPVGQDQGLSLECALPLFTRSAAAVAGWSASHASPRGQISPGFRADLTIWDRSLASLADPVDILSASVRSTLLAGEVVFQA